LCALVALSAAGLAVAVPGSAAPALLQSVNYAVAERVCNAPAPGHKACFAMRLVPASKEATGAQPMAVAAALGTGPGHGYSPADLAKVYGYDRTALVDMTVAIVDAYDYPKAKTDLNHFNAYYGLPAETASSFQKVNQAGQAGPLPLPDKGWAVEIALDIQAVRAVCNTCRILLVEAKSSSSFDLAHAVNTAANLGADVISNSYGGPEQKSEPAWVRQAYDHPGVVITASTGDDGWYSWDRANVGSKGWSYNKANTPAGYKTVVAVAGTRLTTNASGLRAKETVWNANGPHDKFGLRNKIFRGAQGASGGGCSAQYAAPAWQTAATGFHNTGCGTHRMVGDVAAVGDPATGFSVYDSFNQPGWMILGGTSLSSPLIGAMWALAGGSGAEKYPAKTLYDRLTYTPELISDVTTGSNAFCGGDTKSVCSAALRAQIPQTGNPNNLSNGNHHYRNGWAGLLDCGYVRNGGEATVGLDKQCNATVGFDGPSGIGAPASSTLFQPIITAGIGAPAEVDRDVEQIWTANVVDPVPGAVITSYKWNWGDGSTSTVFTAQTSHSFASATPHTVTLTVTDNHGLHRTVSITVEVVDPHG
jgi:hypothetical protein